MPLYVRNPQKLSCPECSNGRGERDSSRAEFVGFPFNFYDLLPTYTVTPNMAEEQIAKLGEKTEQYCVVLQTRHNPPPIQTEWSWRELQCSCRFVSMTISIINL